MGCCAHLGIAAILVITAGCGGSQLSSDPHPLLSTTPPGTQAMTLDGALLRVPTPGHVTLIDFWATSCEPCIQIMPAVEALWREKRSGGLQVVGIASDDNPGLVQERLRKIGITYPNVIDADGLVRGSYRVDALPTTLLIDREGRLRAAHRGGSENNLATLRADVDVLLGEQ